MGGGRVAAALLVLAGCGPRGRDAGADAGSDAGPFGAPFGAPVPIAELWDPAAIDDDPSVSADEREIFWNSDRGGAGDIWRAARATAAEPFGAPALVGELSFPLGETTPELLPGGLALSFAADLGAGGGLDLQLVSRTAPGAAFGAPLALAALSSPATDDGAAFAADGLEVFLASQRGGDQDLWRATRAAAGDAWGAPARVDELSTAGVEGGPALSADGLVLYFHGETTTPPGVHLWRAARADRTAAFGPPALATELNSSGADLDPHLVPDGSAVYFASDRGGSFDLYVARR